MMTVLEFLNRPYRIETDLRMENERLQRYRDMAERCTSGWGVVSSGQSFGHSKMSEAAEKIADCEKRIEAKSAELERATAEAIDVIYSVSSELAAKAMYERFIGRAYLEEIAYSMNYSRRYVQILLKKGLEEAEEYIRDNCPEYLEEDRST